MYEFDTLRYGMVWGETTSIGGQGMATGPQRNVVHNSEFHDIDRQALWEHKGQFNASHNNRFISVGNNGGTEGNAVYSVILFTDGTALSNSSNSDWFDRTASLSYDQNFISGYAYIPEVEGPGVFDNEFSYRFPVTQQNVATRVLRVPGYTTRNIEVEYIYKSSQVNAVREGKLDIVCNIADGTTINNLGIALRNAINGTAGINALVTASWSNGQKTLTIAKYLSIYQSCLNVTCYHEENCTADNLYQEKLINNIWFEKKRDK